MHDTLPSHKIYDSKFDVEAAEAERQEAILKELAQSDEMKAIRAQKRQWERELQESSEESDDYGEHSESEEGQIDERNEIPQVYKDKDGV